MEVQISLQIHSLKSRRLLLHLKQKATTSL